MSPVLMDEELYSSGSSLSAEENTSNTTGSEDNSGMKRREKNRDAARKTRKKQTERADELHQELQRQERAKSALQKEITALKKEVQHYAKILQNHEPHCHLRASHSAFSSTASLPIKDQLKSIPCQSNVLASDSHSAALMSVSTSSLSSKNTNFAGADSTATKFSSSSIPTELTTSSSFTSPVALPYLSAASLQASVSLFNKEPPEISLPEDVIHKTAFMSSAYCNSVTVDEISKKQTSPKNAPSSIEDSFSSLAGKGKGVTTHGSSENVPQLYPGWHSGNLNITGPMTSLPDPPTPTISSQMKLESFPIPPISLKPHFKEQLTPGLSFLGVPSHPNVLENNNDGSQGHLLLPQSTPGDLSFSEFLEGNDWILSESNSY